MSFATPEEVEKYLEMKNKTLDDLDPQYYISVNNDGEISYDTRFIEQFKENNGDMDVLHCVIEDNICWNDECGCEDIDWNIAIKDYNEMIKEGELNEIKRS